MSISSPTTDMEMLAQRERDNPRPPTREELELERAEHAATKMIMIRYAASCLVGYQPRWRAARLSSATKAR